MIKFYGLNADFTRKTGHANYVGNFLRDDNFLKAHDYFPIDFTHYQEYNDITHVSTVDAIGNSGVVHIPENLSDHCPVYCIMNFSHIPADEGPIRKPGPPKPSWSKATQEQKDDFKNHLENALLELDIPESLANCNDVHCDNPLHSETADNIIVDILQSVEKAAYDKLPVPAPQRLRKQKSCKPGWQQFVHPYRQTAQFWHQVWNSAG